MSTGEQPIVDGTTEQDDDLMKVVGAKLEVNAQRLHDLSMQFAKIVDQVTKISDQLQQMNIKSQIDNNNIANMAQRIAALEAGMQAHNEWRLDLTKSKETEHSLLHQQIAQVQSTLQQLIQTTEARLQQQIGDIRFALATQINSAVADAFKASSTTTISDRDKTFGYLFTAFMFVVGIVITYILAHR